MSKVTSKLQLTLPKAIADRYSIRPGDELQWEAAGDGIRIELPAGRTKTAAPLTMSEKLELFDKATERLKRLQKEQPRNSKAPERHGRGWAREELYNRGLPR